MGKKHKKIAIVTGGNRGIGYEVVRGLCKELKDDGIIYLTSRDKKKGKAAVKKLEKEGCYPKYRQVDVKEIVELQYFKHDLYDKYKGIDILVNAAGLKFDETGGTTYKIAGDTLDVNFFCMLHVSSMLYHAFRPHSRIVNIACPASNLSTIHSQDLRDQLVDPNFDTTNIMTYMNKYLKAVKHGKHVEEGWPDTAYALSKLGVIKMTEIQQREFDNRTIFETEDVVINCVNPGHVKTRLNNFEGTISPKEAAKSIIKLALLPPNVESPRGKFIGPDMKIVNWIHNTSP